MTKTTETLDERDLDEITGAGLPAHLFMPATEGVETAIATPTDLNHAKPASQSNGIFSDMDFNDA